jgi:hypothetical protein
MKSQDPIELGNKLGVYMAATLEKFQYFRPTRDYKFVQIKKLPPRDIKTESAIKNFVDQRNRLDQEMLIIKEILEPFTGMITAPNASQERQIMEYIYEVYMKDMEDLMSMTGLDTNGLGMPSKFGVKDVAADYDAFEIQMNIVKSYIEKAAKKIMVNG